MFSQLFLCRLSKMNFRLSSDLRDKLNTGTVHTLNAMPRISKEKENYYSWSAEKKYRKMKQKCL